MTDAFTSNHWLAETWKLIEQNAAETDQGHRISLSPLGCAALVAERHSHEQEMARLQTDLLGAREFMGSVSKQVETAARLLREPGPLPPGCYCSERCMAPVVMGQQTPCRDPEKAARFQLKTGCEP